MSSGLVGDGGFEFVDEGEELSFSVGSADYVVLELADEVEAEFAESDVSVVTDSVVATDALVCWPGFMVPG